MEIIQLPRNLSKLASFVLRNDPQGLQQFRWIWSLWNVQTRRSLCSLNTGFTCNKHFAVSHFSLSQSSKNWQIHHLNSVSGASRSIYGFRYSYDALRACPLKRFKICKDCFNLNCDSSVMLGSLDIHWHFNDTAKLIVFLQFYFTMLLRCCVFFILPPPKIVQNCSRPIFQSPFKDFAHSVHALSPQIS